ncbi:methyltransferase domain-containing protein [Dolichospermum circinale CS-1225]|uniref:methyltransferase domain-containing protein n=1 Tax=Dolichospermum circinale TaxID=109265 RepID=UPI00040285BE|nr:methyltransferase domain-containing protein [Dolichospermum circinale]MDB9521112.1 methyltransferase domain-containing protein [Dolichospermum circinale CS-1225]
MNIKNEIKKIYNQVILKKTIHSRQALIDLYIKNGRKPWSNGYSQFKEYFIKQSINEESLIETFRKNLALPEGYGEFLDERVVEYLWFLSRVANAEGTLLDAGSILNYQYILSHLKLNKKEVSIMTLEPEADCFWKSRISYHFGDLRYMPFRNDYFNEVVSISTLEHIGMDNSMYSPNDKFKQNNKLDFLKAVSEIKRVTKPGGKVYITVPYGKYTDFGWYQQFDSNLINKMIDVFSPSKLIETYYCYESGGWRIGDKLYCEKFEGFNIHDTKYFNPNSTKEYDPDYAACSRGIAALELWK